jgi:hypothetical protein
MTNKSMCVAAGLVSLILLTVGHGALASSICPIEWLRGYGGSGDDWLSDLVQKSGGGFAFVSGSSSSGDGTKTSTNYCFRNSDFWIVNCDADGRQLWDRSFGGDSFDFPLRILQDPDGGFTLAG